MNNITDQMPEFLRIIENSLRSGYSIVQALGLAAEELDAPLQGEAQSVLDDLEQGSPLPQALDNWLDRAPHPDLDLLVATLKVQFEVGGNLADKLQLLGQIIPHRKGC